MAIQQIWDVCSSMTINRRKLVGVQYTRSQIPRTDLTPTKNPWRFTLTIPGLPWNQMRPIIEGLDYLDRYQPETIVIGNNPNMAWLYGYRGDNPTTPTGITVSSFVGTQMVLGNLPSIPSTEYLFRSGDMIQIVGKPYPFTIVTDVLRGSGSSVTVTTHRPNIITTAVSGLQINVAENCQISVFMPDLPTYKLTPGAYRLGNNNQVLNNAIVEFSSEIGIYEWLAGS